jgi:hypothetical protein
MATTGLGPLLCCLGSDNTTHSQRTRSPEFSWRPGNERSEWLPCPYHAEGLDEEESGQHRRNHVYSKGSRALEATRETCAAFGRRHQIKAIRVDNTAVDRVCHWMHHDPRRARPFKGLSRDRRGCNSCKLRAGCIGQYPSRRIWINPQPLCGHVGLQLCRDCPQWINSCHQNGSHSRPSPTGTSGDMVFDGDNRRKHIWHFHMPSEQCHSHTLKALTQIGCV